MPYTPILATLGYILSPDGRRVLLVHRKKRPDDPHYGKYNGLGGKLQAGEDIVACMRREIREEADLECVNMVLRGTISWPGFGSKKGVRPHLPERPEGCFAQMGPDPFFASGEQGEDWFGFIFRVDTWSGTPRNENAEGALAWIEIERVLTLPLWEGDRYFLPLVFERDERQFHGVMPYRDGKPVSWTWSHCESPPRS